MIIRSEAGCGFTQPLPHPGHCHHKHKRHQRITNSERQYVSVYKGRPESCQQTSRHGDPCTHNLPARLVARKHELVACHYEKCFTRRVEKCPREHTDNEPRDLVPSLFRTQSSLGNRCHGDGCHGDEKCSDAGVAADEHVRRLEVDAGEEKCDGRT